MAATRALACRLSLGALVLGCGGAEDPPPGGGTRGGAAAAEPSDGGGPLETGRFHLSRPPASGDRSPSTEDELEGLEALGYAQGTVPAGDLSGVLRHDPERSAGGWNLYTSGHRPFAALMDMEGEQLHAWSRDYAEVWPERPEGLEDPDARFWRRVRLLEGGDLLAIQEDLGIFRLDRDSRVVWKRALPVHHDLEVRPGGEIWVLLREPAIAPEISHRPIMEDFVAVLDPEGRELRRISLVQAFLDSEDEHSWLEASTAFWKKEEERRIAFPRWDVFHTNSLRVLDGRIADVVPSFEEGNLLLSFLHLDTIAVLDLGAEKIVWSLRGPFALQHDPTITSDGRILLFDNHAVPGHRSSILMIDPASEEVAWEYRGTDADPLYSKTCGTVAELPNGNLLVTETDNGRALEVTRDREVVWEFRSPHRAGERDQFVASLFEVTRLRPDLPLGWID